MASRWLTPERLPARERTDCRVPEHGITGARNDPREGPLDWGASSEMVCASPRSMAPPITRSMLWPCTRCTERPSGKTTMVPLVEFISVTSKRPFFGAIRRWVRLMSWLGLGTRSSCSPESLAGARPINIGPVSATRSPAAVSRMAAGRCAAGGGGLEAREARGAPGAGGSRRAEWLAGGTR